MARGGYREEVFNVLLALLLHQRGIVSAPEKSFRQVLTERRRYPDVLVEFHGLRTVIEGKVADTPNAAESALQQAQERVDRGIAHIGVAVVYPADLRKAPFSGLEAALGRATLRVATRSEAGGIGWTEGGVEHLIDVLRSTFDELVKEDVVSKAVEVLNAGVSTFALWGFATPATAIRAADILGISMAPPAKRRRPEADTDEESE